MSTAILEARALSKFRGPRQVLNGIDLHIEAGEAVSVIGPNGSGKTTLLQALALTDEADTGFLRIVGHEFEFGMSRTTQLKESPIWPKVTLVFQQLSLWPHLTVEKNLLLPHESDPVSIKEVRPRLTFLAKELGIDLLLNRFPNQVSQGERQRAALIRALLLSPKVLLLDEITSAQDIEQIPRILRVLQSEKKQGLAIVFVSHSMGFVRSLSDRFYFLDQGSLLESGRIEQLSHANSERLRVFLSYS